MKALWNKCPAWLKSFLKMELYLFVTGFVAAANGVIVLRDWRAYVLAGCAGLTKGLLTALTTWLKNQEA